MSSDTTSRTIVVGITGGIAAYKAVGVIRAFVGLGHDVHVIPTEGALRFIGLPTLEAISRNPVSTSVFEEVAEVRHVALGRRADLVVIAPATADSMARMANGLASDLLGTTLLATTAPVVIAPAMHPQMWEHPATRANVATLVSRGVHLVGPETGPLTGGDSGIGRMSEPDDIVAAALDVLGSGTPHTGPEARHASAPPAASAGARVGDPDRSVPAGRGTGLPSDRPAPDARRGDLSGTRIVISAGGTREPFDPVRYVGNRSSGRQGVAIAAEASARGAMVTLVSANVERGVLAAVETRPGQPSSVDVVPVGSAEELATTMRGLAADADVVVMTAAVADYRPVDVLDTKLKKESAGDTITMTLVRNPDVLAELVAARRPGQLIVGFAAETEPDRLARLELGRAKIARKPADMLVVNHVGWSKGFERDENAIEVLVPGGDLVREASGSKAEVAHVVLDLVATALA
ncbi:bifunctional phosphopantothenoylcysteine decarboxylase/phosphopantothenate synthase [Curtobacterium sp. Leaf261]|uniref:bifunctional phosphopantothenoylcysteine decarboxylase/phosphopantothenate synthase n=1 Tax=Curtobacterium sp. Leaf261 TaxID=1736311 RepID=UPI0006F74C08|nr:bifunctional phosphopantothenoylcysteine decarboxylase/phosphopantothenate synthase [Curtobacterium sp. Leaf261]KQO62423.1 phosphopantothenoylcysteine decarboxylase [Curtobacterium sp. Leaf261]